MNMQNNIQFHIMSLNIIKFQANTLRYVVADKMNLFLAPPKLFAKYFNINMFYQYRDCHCKEKTVFIMEMLIPKKKCLYGSRTQRPFWVPSFHSFLLIKDNFQTWLHIFFFYIESNWPAAEPPDNKEQIYNILVTINSMGMP